MQDGKGTWEEEARGSLQIQHQQRLYSETPSFKINRNSKWFMNK